MISAKNSIYRLIMVLTFFSTVILFTGCANISFNAKIIKKPKNLKVSSITSETATVSWSPVKNAGYYFLTITAKGYEKQETRSTSKTSYDLYNLYFDQDYTVSVVAADSYLANSISYKSTVNFTTLPDVTPEGEFNRPQNVKPVFNAEKNELTVSWDAVPDAAYYDIYLEYVYSYRAPPPDKHTGYVFTVPATQTTFTDKPQLSKEVCVKVAARNKDFSDSCRWSKDIFLKL